MHTPACPEGCQAPYSNLLQTSHAHTVDAQKKAQLLWIALGLIGGFSIVELAVSLSSHSLALLAEAGHMLSDVGALGLALLATWISGWPASAQAPFGYRRVEILAALANGLGLVAIALWIGWEAVERLQHPDAEVLGLPMLITAAVGLGVNLLNAKLLHNHSHHDLNLKGAFLHIVSDAIGSLGVILAAIAVWLFGWVFAHIYYLIEFDNKLIVMLQWGWNYFTRKRGARLITGEGGVAAAESAGTYRAKIQEPMEV